MFLNNSSLTRPPPSLLPGSDGTRSPSFNRYYEAATTTGRFLRHSVCSVAAQFLGLISNFRSSSRGNHRANARVLFDRCHPLPSGALSQGRLRFSQVPCEPLVHLPCSQTPAGPPRQAIAAFRCCPRTARRRRPRRLSTFEAQSHGFCTGCLRFVPSSRTTTQNSLPVVSQPFRMGFLIPTEFVRRVSTIASSLPGLILARLARAHDRNLLNLRTKSK